MSTTYDAFASHSHLFRGARVRVDMSGFTGALEPLGLRLHFADGSLTTAELLLAASDRGAALDVARYRTASGTVIPEKTWTVTAERTSGGGMELKIGRMLDGGAA
ncbi:hypothetical protein BIU82_08450 [Arthrobacter sp. SW1]|uniref:hypothetical protein n=1 Tax=Arthrobacter sp. SW1 TaxID=1920889 RepID=UPI000877C1B3|nr:hypothetical protein [Arthrobacter sp. SW1]OFI37126.1 hypothetical protein BIU82_08450 [Arthrobacter sp. SW1]